MQVSKVIVTHCEAKPAEFATADKPLADFLLCLLLAVVIIIVLTVLIFVVIYKLAVRDIKKGRADPVTTQKYKHSKRVSMRCYEGVSSVSR